jgi:hypothetical protein
MPGSADQFRPDCDCSSGDISNCDCNKSNSSSSGSGSSGVGGISVIWIIVGGFIAMSVFVLLIGGFQ